MNIQTLLSGGIDKVIDSVGNALDRLVTSDAEREEIKKELEQIKLNAILQSEDNALKLESQITDRWKSDNEHGITRLVRPSIVIWAFFLFTLVLLTDGNIGTFKINGAYIPILETVLVTTIVAYFGSRGVEKTTKTLKGKQDVLSKF